MAKTFTYGRQERLKSRKLIEQLFREGTHLGLFPFKVFYLFRPREASGAPVGESGTVWPPLQCGFGVSSRQFRKAVHRNRVKRVAREAWRLQKQPLAEAMLTRPEQLALFIIYTGKELPEYGLVKDKMALIIQKLLTIVRREKNPPHL